MLPRKIFTVLFTSHVCAPVCTTFTYINSRSMCDFVKSTSCVLHKLYSLLSWLLILGQKTLALSNVTDMLNLRCAYGTEIHDCDVEFVENNTTRDQTVVFINTEYMSLLGCFVCSRTYAHRTRALLGINDFFWIQVPVDWRPSVVMATFSFLLKFSFFVLIQRFYAIASSNI